MKSFVKVELIKMGVVIKYFLTLVKESFASLCHLNSVSLFNMFVISFRILAKFGVNL